MDDEKPAPLADLLTGAGLARACARHHDRRLADGPPRAPVRRDLYGARPGARAARSGDRADVDHSHGPRRCARARSRTCACRQLRIADHWRLIAALAAVPQLRHRPCRPRPAVLAGGRTLHSRHPSSSSSSLSAAATARWRAAPCSLLSSVSSPASPSTTCSRISSWSGCPERPDVRRDPRLFAIRSPVS